MANTTAARAPPPPPPTAPCSSATIKPKVIAVHQRDNRQGMHFPWKLHELLEKTGKGHSSVVSWLPGGKAFKVHKKENFCDELMPAFFHSSKYKTFQRSLNLWGFKSVSRGPDKGACYHQFFVRGNVDLCKNMIRVKIKGGGTAGVPSSSEPKTATSAPQAQESSLATKLSQLSAAATRSSKFSSSKPVTPSIPATSAFIRCKLNSHGSSMTRTLGNPVAALMPQRPLMAPMTSNPLSLAERYYSNASSFMSGAHTVYPSLYFDMQHNMSLDMIPSRNRLLSAMNTAAAALDIIRQGEDAILRQANL
jgi:hypothetical protein